MAGRRKGSRRVVSEVVRAFPRKVRLFTTEFHGDVWSAGASERERGSPAWARPRPKDRPALTGSIFRQVRSGRDALRASAPATKRPVSALSRRDAVALQ